MKQSIFAIICAGLILLGSCATPNEPSSVDDRLARLVQNNQPLSLYDRFVRVALTDRAGRPLDRLYRWPDPLRIEYLGPDQYRADVEEHAEILGAATGLPVHKGADNANMIVRIAHPDDLKEGANRVTPQPYGYSARIFICSTVQAEGSTLGQLSVIVDIADDLPPSSIKQCIVQEMTQALGLIGDLDGDFGSRQDTNFASWGGSPTLTEHDLALLRILYDPRLRNGMSRDRVMPIVREIVAEMEAEAGR